MITFPIYKSFFSGGEYDISITSDEIIISDNKYENTGVLDKEDRFIYRQKEPIGFRIRKDI